MLRTFGPNSSTLVRLLTPGIRSMWGHPGTVLCDSARDVRVNSWPFFLCCALSHVSLGFACVAPPGGKAGIPLSKTQLEMCDTLWRRVASMRRLLQPSGMCGASLDRLLGNLSNLEAEFCAVDLIPYSRLRTKPQDAGAVLEHGPVPRGPPPGRPGPLVADRIDFPVASETSNPNLSCHTAVAFVSRPPICF